MWRWVVGWLSGYLMLGYVFITLRSKGDGCICMKSAGNGPVGRRIHGESIFKDDTVKKNS